MGLACFSSACVDLYDYVKKFFLELKLEIALWISDNQDWSMVDMQGRGYNRKISNAYYGRKAEARDKIEELTKELIKSNFCKEVLENPPLDESDYDAKLSTLRKLERQYPDLKREYSPTQYKGFREDMALLAYGQSSKNGWQVIKRTLWLTKKDIADYPSVFSMPADGEFGI